MRVVLLFLFFSPSFVYKGVQFPFDSYLMPCISFWKLFYFFAETVWFFICFKCVHDCLLKRFMLAALKCLSDNFNISVMLVVASIDSFFIQFKIFPVFGMATNLLSKHEHLAYYIMKLWVLFQTLYFSWLPLKLLLWGRMGFHCCR